MMPIVLPTSTSPARSRLPAVNSIRHRALERLYERRAALESLIQSLEDYQRVHQTGFATPLGFSAERKCS
jgi:hypothetical protein